MRDALALELAADHTVTDPETGRKIKIRKLRLVIRSLINKAIKGDVAAIREINERMDGKVATVVKGEGEGGAIPIDIRNLTTAQLEQLKERLIADLTAKGIIGAAGTGPARRGGK
jgi:hypothetical protein